MLTTREPAHEPPVNAPVGVLERPRIALTARAQAIIWRQCDGPIFGKVAPFAAVLTIAAVLVALAHTMNHTSYIVWGGLWLAPLLFVIALPMANRARRLDGDAIGRIVLAGAALKVFVSPLLRYWMAFGLYGGAADSARYHAEGALLAPLFRHGIYQDLGEVSSTRFISVLTGQVYTVTGPTRLGGFIVFSFFAFVGCYLFYRAFRTACPDGDGRRYAKFVFLFPGLVFWPSSIGKEGFMILVLGVAAFGAAQLFTGRMRGLVWLALGSWGALVVRPHLALMIGAGLMVAAPLALLGRGAHGHTRQRGRLGSAVLLVAILVAGSSFVGVAEEFLGLDSLNAETAREQLDEVTERTTQGGSTFTAHSPTNPVGFVLAGATILFRPLPFEVGSVQALLAALESLMLLVLCGLSLRRLARLPVEIFRRPYVAFGLAYTFAFIFAFSSIVNFGILARQRTQLLPILFVFLCIAKRKSTDTDAASLEEVSR